MKITALMTVRNEAHRYLDEVMAHLETLVDSIIIVDDASTDNTVDIVKSYSKVEKIYVMREQKFYNEWVLRKFAWDKAKATGADWLLLLDADELFEDKFKDVIREHVNQSDVDAWYFWRYDLWGSREYYREDVDYQPHNTDVRPQLIRVLNVPEQWNQSPIHCHSFPISVFSTHRCKKSDIRLKHLGWSSHEFYEERYKRYMEHDPDEARKQAMSPTLPMNVTLKKWIE